jgi:hypothetical protein
MRFVQEDRGQAIQVGAVLLFGILIIFLSTYQAFVVPNQNEEIEFNHNTEVQQQMTELRSNVVSMPDSSSTRATAIDLGVRYPSRTVFVNPGPVSGRVRTVGTENENVNLTLQNIQAVTSEGETGDFWDGTVPAMNTGAIEYRPDYNLYQFAPRTVYEHSVLYNQFEDENDTLALTDQTLIDGKQITLVALNGSLSETRVGTASVDLSPKSTRSRVVEVTNRTNNPITIQTATNINESEWRSLLSDEQYLASPPTVRDTGDVSILELELEPGENYKLRLAKVGVGSGATETDPAYLTDVAGNGTSVSLGETRQLTVEVRDKFNVPQSSVRISANAAGGSFTGSTSGPSDEHSKSSDTDGQVTFTYEAENSGTHQIDFTIEPGFPPDSGHDSTTPTNVTMTVTVPMPPSPGGGGSGAYETFWQAQHPFVESIDDIDGIEYYSSNDTYTYNASQAGNVDLIAQTDPVIDDATVDFAVNDTGVARVDPQENQTQSNGQTRTTLRPQQTGSVDVYASSGGTGDNVTFKITSVDKFSNLGLDVQPNTAGSQAVHNWTFDAVDLNCNDANCVDTITLDYGGDVTFDGNSLDASDVTYSVEGNDDVNILDVSVVDSGDSIEIDVSGVPTSDPNNGGYVRVDGTNGGLTNPPNGGGYTAAIEFDGRSGQSNDFVSGTTSYSIPEPANFSVSITGTNSSVTEGEDLTIDYDVTNTGDLSGTQDITLNISGIGTNLDIDNSVTLDGGEPASGTLTYTTQDGDAGSYTATVASENDSETTPVTIDEPAFFNVAINSTNSPVDEGETLLVNGTVTNTGDVAGTQTLNLTDFNGDEQSNTSVTLNPGQSKSIQLNWTTGSGDDGTGNVTLFSEDDNATTKVTVNATLPNNAVAFADADGDGVYDNNEQAYTESEVAQLGTSVDLVIERDVTVNKIQISTQSVQLKNSAKLDTKNELKLDISENIDIRGGTLDSENKITLKSSSSGIEAQGATFESKNEMKMTAEGGELSLTDAEMDSENKITLSASSKVNAQSATFESKNEIKITANGGDVDISGGALTIDNKITIKSSADIDARDTELQAKNQIKATPASAGTLLVNDNGGTRADGGTYIEDQNGNASEIRLQQGSVTGTPEKGSVTT